MSNGLSSPDSAVGIHPPEIRTPLPQENFTPLPKSVEPTVTRPLEFEEPTTIDDTEVNRLVADILDQGKPKNPQAAVQQVEKNLPQETKKSQGILVQIFEWLRTTFKNLFS